MLRDLLNILGWAWATWCDGRAGRDVGQSMKDQP